MNRLKSFIAILMTGFLVSASVNAEVLTLEDAAGLAMENNFSIRISEIDVEVAETEHTLGNAGYFPSIRFEGSNNMELMSSRQEFIEGEPIDRDQARSSSYIYGIRMDYPLFTGFGRRHHYNSLKEAIHFTRSRERAQIEEMLFELVTVYYEIRQYKQFAEVLQNSIEISEQRLNIAERQSEIGSGSRMHVLQAQADLNAERSQMLEYENNITRAKVRLNQLLGRDPAIDFEVSQEVSFVELLGMEELRQQALENNPLLQAHEHNRQIAGYQINREQATRYPTAGLNVGYNFSQSQSESGFVSSSRNLGWNAGVTIRFNIFDGFNTNRRIQTARLYHEQSDLMLEEEKHRVMADIEEHLVNYNNRQRQLELEADNAAVVEENISFAIEQYELGMITSVELREAQNSLLESESRLREAEYRAKIAEAQLLRLSGSLHEAIIP